MCPNHDRAAVLVAQIEPPVEIPFIDLPTMILIGSVIVLLGIATAIGRYLRRMPETTIDPGMVEMFNARIRAWWLMCVILGAAFLFFNPVPTIILFGLVSFWALREFITLTPTRMGDHRALFWVFFFFTPLQYLLVGWGEQYYGIYSILIPVYAFLFIPARVAISGDPKRFLERTAKIQSGLMVCVYSLSYAPALFSLRLKDHKGDLWDGSTAGLLFFFIVVVQLNDVFQYAWGRLLGRRLIAPEINASKTWEGMFAGIASTTLVGMTLWWVTPFRPWEAACMSLVIGVMGFAGSLTMSAIKRDRGVKDFGTLVQGHAGVLDRIDSLCFAAPVFFHLTRLYPTFYPTPT